MSILCKVMRVSRSGFYEWKNRVDSAHAQWRRKVGDLIEVFFDASEQTYGYRRIHADLLVTMTPSVRSCASAA